MKKDQINELRTTKPYLYNYYITFYFGIYDFFDKNLHFNFKNYDNTIYTACALSGAEEITKETVKISCKYFLDKLIKSSIKVNIVAAGTTVIISTLAKVFEHLHTKKQEQNLLKETQDIKEIFVLGFDDFDTEIKEIVLQCVKAKEEIISHDVNKAKQQAEKDLKTLFYYLTKKSETILADDTISLQKLFVKIVTMNSEPEQNICIIEEDEYILVSNDKDDNNSMINDDQEEKEYSMQQPTNTDDESKYHTSEIREKIDRFSLNSCDKQPVTNVSQTECKYDNNNQEEKKYIPANPMLNHPELIDKAVYEFGDYARERLVMFGAKFDDSETLDTILLGEDAFQHICTILEHN